MLKNTERILAFLQQNGCAKAARCYIIRDMTCRNIADSFVYYHVVKVTRFTFKCEIIPIFSLLSCRHSSLGCATAQ